MTRYWTCRSCKVRHPRRKAKCFTPGCTGRRPKPRQPAHKAALKDPYEVWVERFGEACGICGRGPGSRRLDRDHCHKGDGTPRGLLCARCNRALPNWVTAEWLRRAADYLERADHVR